MMTFHTQLPGLLTIVLFVASACNSAEVPPTDRVSLGINQSARLGSAVVVRVNSIQDSRCPANVTCVWAGEAKVNVHLAKDQEATEIELVLGPAHMNKDNKRPDSTGVTFAKETYKVVLRDVNPYPGTAPANQPQTATVEVAKL